jgi:beta-mannosidase
MALTVPSRRIDLHHSAPLADGWSLLRTPPDAWAEPADLPERGWRAVSLPGTVAHWLESDACEGQGLDAFDWWLRRELPAWDAAAGQPRVRFEGLATQVDVWVDGRHLLSACNMHRCFLLPLPAGARTLVLRFAALAPRLQQRHPRPRWKTALVPNQNLRWFRTTLLGRTSTWLPRVDAVGPWRPVHFELARGLDLEHLRLIPMLRDGRAVVRLAVSWRDLGGGPWTAAVLQVGSVRRSIDARHLHATGIDAHDVEFDGLEPWWPHTHGRPVTHACALHLQGGSAQAAVDCGQVGFKSFEVLDAEGALRMRCNQEAVFLRGACWTTADLRRLDADVDTLRAVLARVADAGMNMLRIVGTAVYASEALLAECDRLGILVWQDFQFASMDYPLDDPGFASEARAEAEEVLQRLGLHACVAVYCGNSEVEQQAAMLGLPADNWSHAFFAQWLPQAHAEHHPASAYVRASPSGGALPFHASSGVSHYYGVGAYRRPLADVRLSGVRFAAECLGFSNVPAPTWIERDELAGVAPHDPRWKAGVPRDAGAGWDFEDVRDHYFASIVRADPRDTRLVDPRGYLRWSGLVSGEVMTAAFASWRAPGSGCQGALVWWLQDLAAGAGWGVLDWRGHPKPAYWALRRCLAPRAVLVEDRGLEGCDFIVCNDAPEELRAELTVELWQDGRIRTLSARQMLRLGARVSSRIGTSALFGHFVDINHAYRFGAPAHDLISARLVDASGALLAQAFHFPSGMSTRAVVHAPRASVTHHGPDRCLHLHSEELLLGVEIDAPGFEPADNFFHLVPGEERTVHLRATAGRPQGRVRCSAANLRDGVTVRDV